MAIRIVRLGTPRTPDEGLRLGTVRHPPRGVRKQDWGARDYFDVWLPELSPSEDLRAWALAEPLTPRRWASYQRRYLAQMRRPQAQRLIAMLAALSRQTNFSVGCYCADELLCHRSLLRILLAEQGAAIVQSE
ncbi:MAG: DUF488 family protein [Pleurocapsa minor GSE-CHR-MK-17-07R]|jgi:uncharacterized protein YeaO (DUF488 family)|nr:DUF488 family protein [Pleurocapsa minor GSE-CHR-MK 17-07R]